MTTRKDSNSKERSVDRLLRELQERAKELNCLYQVEDALSQHDATTEETMTKILEAIPPGWQYPDVCVARITFGDQSFTSPGFTETTWVQKADILSGTMTVGSIEVYYTKQMPIWDDGPFLKEEAKLVHTIADRIGHRLMHQKMRSIVGELRERRREHENGEWRVVLQMLKQTDRNLYLSVSRKMLNHLCWSGVEEADELMKTFTPDSREVEASAVEDSNRPWHSTKSGFSFELSDAVFRIAKEHLTDDETFQLLQKWIQEDKLSFLVQVVNRNLSLSDVADAIRRYHYLAENEPEIQSPNKRGIEVSLIRRFLSDHLQYINVAKNYIEVHDFYHLLNRVIFSSESHGKLGGKSAGLYLAAQVLKKKSSENELLGKVKIPKTYHITSDVLLHFMHYNNFDEVVEQKYKPISQVRFEYPHVLQTFTSSRFPSEIVNGLSVALDDFNENPLIVRSSSLLEDRIGAAFSGKYKSLFLANQGSKQQRLKALMEAIAEVYASTFSPDPIEYRAERGLLDFGEEMGIIIQEVVGSRVGKYFLPSFAGVAFSQNEFRWSPRIRREDGLIRLVPGLGTRAVDRLADDYPVLIAPGQPGLRVNATPDETARYAPAKLDVINLESNNFETIEFQQFLREGGDALPAIEKMVSIFEGDSLRSPTGSTTLSGQANKLIVTFESLVSRSEFVKKTKAILDTLQEALGYPVDIEFAHDGTNFYLLQCRSQSHSALHAPAPIPKGTPRDKTIFTARKYVTNGWIPDITHIVYVDPRKYSELPDRAAMIDVGRAVSRLNKLLPKRQFVLMGPGRWGSRGDIKLGVPVTYSDINNTAALIEIALQKGNYVPDLSFGTHFFQDLVEADIRYLPLYPDDKDIVFNDKFFMTSENVLADLAPEYARLKDIIRVIDVPRNAKGLVLRVHMNADLDEAIGVLSEPTTKDRLRPLEPVVEPFRDEQFWRWRLQMAECMAKALDTERLGVQNLYVFGSTKNATAGPASDIDMLVHFRGTSEQRHMLENWFDGWSRCLAETNYLQTGYRTDSLLDVHIITDKDIEEKTSWASKIDAVTDAARPLTINRKKEK